MATVQGGNAEHDSVFELLTQSKTIAELLNFNFSGDANFERPSEAPGLAGMVQCVVTLLTAAEAAAKGLALPAATRNAIHEAAALAIHLAAASKETLLEGTRCFNYGDAFVGMCYSTLKSLADRAIDELVRKPAA
ncbi:MAG TPA: hypothetical protein VN280_22450 [Variovorax sp.]|nr:hypothetical protein [Variovorax sp.]